MFVEQRRPPWHGRSNDRCCRFVWLRFAKVAGSFQRTNLRDAKDFSFKQRRLSCVIEVVMNCSVWLRWPKFNQNEANLRTAGSGNWQRLPVEVYALLSSTSQVETVSDPASEHRRRRSTLEYQRKRRRHLSHYT